MIDGHWFCRSGRRSMPRWGPRRVMCRGWATSGPRPPPETRVSATHLSSASCASVGLCGHLAVFTQSNETGQCARPAPCHHATPEAPQTGSYAVTSGGLGAAEHGAAGNFAPMARPLHLFFPEDSVTDRVRRRDAEPRCGPAAAGAPSPAQATCLFPSQLSHRDRTVWMRASGGTISSRPGREGRPVGR